MVRFIKGYDINIQYHLGKTNVVADALSQKMQHTLNVILVTQSAIQNDLRKLEVEIIFWGKRGSLMRMEVQSHLLDEIKKA